MDSALQHHNAVHAGVSGVILAGGASRRLGRDKALEPVGGRPLICRVMDRLDQVADAMVVVVNSDERARELPLSPSAKAAVDLYPDKGSLGGIFTGLSASERGWGLVVACDMPFLNVDLLDHMLSLRDGYDAVVPVVDGRPEPTHAAYSVSCLPAIEARVVADDLKIARFFDDVRVRFVTEEEVARLDPHGLSFFNVNTQEDLDRTLELVAQER